MQGYFLDFYSHQARLAVELDGGQHFETVGAEMDRRRDQRLSDCGIRVLRFDDATVLCCTESVIEEIQRVWTERVSGPGAVRDRSTPS
jgi:very-short-patch-repair endonuclease